MIVRWKMRGACEYVAEWQGIHLSLQYQPEQHNWSASICNAAHCPDNAKATERWNTAHAAIDAVDAVVLGIIMKRAGVVAKQRPSSLERISHHATR